MTKNLLDALINIVNNSRLYLTNGMQVSENRMNSMGDSLEKFVVDSFANTFEYDECARNVEVNKIFSYLGNNTNPPDALIKNGIAIETKKIKSRKSQLQLNSSNPKAKLYADDSRINVHARMAEEWVEKDFVYAVGVVPKQELTELAFIDASVYCADKEIYQKVFEAVKTGVEQIPNIEFHVTKELGRVNKIDPLKITNLRVRGMWLLDNPFDVFGYVYEPKDVDFNLFTLISTVHFSEFENREEFLKLVKATPNLEIMDVQVKNPNNPAQLVDCKKITFFR